MTRENNNPSQTFSCTAPRALGVLLAGDSTNCQEKAIPMKKQTNGLWQTSVKLAPGTYHYRIIVDGEWRDDPDCTLRVPNPFGGEDAVRLVA